MKILARTQFGNLVLRKPARRLSVGEIKSQPIQNLIANMRHTLLEKKLGIGLAAPQVGKGLALTVITIRPTTVRPDTEPFDLVLINPEITECIGRKQAEWEGCISAGSHGKADLFAKVPRYKKVRVRYHDENGEQQEKVLEGLHAHVAQHEIDHLNGVLFVDRVKDTKTYMTYKEYKKRQKNKLL
jgi:peptide deformylase